MFKVLRAVANNLNKSHYLMYRNRINYKKQGQDFDFEEANDKTSVKDLAGKIDKIEYLQTVVRDHNLKLFASAVAKARLQQFAVYTVPAMLIGASIFTFTLPNSEVKTKTLDAFKATERVFNQEYCIEGIDNGDIYYNTILLTTKFVKPTDHILPSETYDYNDSDISDIMYFYIRDDLDDILAKFVISPDGMLSLEETCVGKFVDLQAYDFSGAEPLDDEYAKLFDDVIAILQDSIPLSHRVKEVLENLLAADKKDILVRIIELEGIGPLDVDVIANNIWIKIVSVVAVILYVVALSRLANDKRLGYKRLYVGEDGALHLSEKAEENLWFLIKRYKEAFLVAESDRVKNIYELYCETVQHTSYTPSSLLTGYERRLIL